MNKTVEYDKRDKKKIISPVSLYQPSDEVQARTMEVMADYQYGIDIQNKTYTEFNNRTLLSEVDANQKAFNSYVPTRSEDPDESWRAQTVRPITRNKLISIAAHTTEPILYPSIFAQNESDEEDRDAAQVMKDIVEYVIDNSNYVRSFVQAIIAMLVDPVMILNVEYAEVYRTVKDIQADGSWTVKDIIDEVLSGHQFNLVPCKELLIANIYEPNIQKQRFLIRNKLVDYKECELVYGKKSNFQYVKPGIFTVFNLDTKTFYDVPDETLEGHLVREVVYYNRAQDIEEVYLNGILVTEPNAPLRRKDKLYPFAKSGYEPIGNGQFFYYKSAANKLGSDQEIVDTLYNMIIDGTFLSIMPPMALYGSEDIDSSVTIPGTVTSFTDPNTKMENIGPRSDIRAGLEAIQKVESSMSESSQDNMRSGVSDGGGRTAREVLLLEKNARIALGLFGKSIRFFVEDTGDLLVGDILQHATVGDFEETTDLMKFRSFILPDKIDNGKKVTKQIKMKNPADFSDDMDMDEASFKLMEKEGGYDSDKRIAEVNVEIFRQNRYKTRVSADDLTPPSKTLARALDMELFDRTIQLGPLVDQEACIRDFLLEPFKPGESDKYMPKNQAVAPALPGMDPAQQAANPNGKTNTSMLSQLTGSNSLGVAASSE